jgi:hypothetical protein
MSLKEDLSYMLSQEVQSAIDTGDEDLISFIRSLWNNESWESIMRKFQTEGNVWVVWWSDGVNAYYQALDP